MLSYVNTTQKTAIIMLLWTLIIPECNSKVTKAI